MAIASVYVFHLQYIVQCQVSEGFAAQDESLRGLFGLMHLVSGCLGILDLGQLHVLPHTVKLLLSVLELTHVPARGIEKKRLVM